MLFSFFSGYVPRAVVMRLVFPGWARALHFGGTLARAGQRTLHSGGTFAREGHGSHSLAGRLPGQGKGATVWRDACPRRAKGAAVWRDVCPGKAWEPQFGRKLAQAGHGRRSGS
jgi:hypothetical protein